MIRVLRHWRGVASGLRPIAPGDYAEDDPALWGAAESLLIEGVAIRISEAAHVSPEPGAEPEPPEEPDGGETVSPQDAKPRRSRRSRGKK